MDEVKFYRSEKVERESIVLLRPQLILEKCRFKNCALAAIAMNPPHAEAYDKIDAYDTEFDRCTFFMSASMVEELAKTSGLPIITHPIRGPSVLSRIKGIFTRG